MKLNFTYSDELYHYGTKGMQWGVRRYRNYDGTRTEEGKKLENFAYQTRKVKSEISNNPKPLTKEKAKLSEVKSRGSLTAKEARECMALADELYNKAAKREPKITSDVVDAVTKAGGRMHGLNNRLKQPGSIAAKIGANAKEDEVSFQEASRGINDLLRYTSVSGERDFVANYERTKDNLLKKGYAETKCKNYFSKYQAGEVKHKAVQSTFSKNGVNFEVQFQTPESQAAKELKVPLYNAVRKKGVSDIDRIRLENAMTDLAEKVPDPDMIHHIKSY